ncbi:helix-turn-helix transcriptional regulator [Gordonia McavH-238-E]|uniref:helix-turn-helix transcriptional regulator n=1 Tax=Gordonia sp. McavH-238-E TaxID=2917736 RepID=UPI001EF54275|nr:helix-turn-helix transcriptional regulator [Gordonia sp. McavH-238-E]MCG7634500.1 helix-turn-helix transcriptional regulator [Gordonia sp. McavH-238-E]
MTPTTPVSMIGDLSPAASRISSWISGVVDRAQGGHPLCAVVVGTPGSGRSTLLGGVREQLRQRGLPVSVGLPTGSETGPVFVLADDMHLWPGPVIDTALGMLDAGTIGLIATTEPRELDPSVRLLRDRSRPYGAVLELEALGTADVLTRATRTGLTLDPTTASQIRRRCGGAPVLVDSALEAIRNAGLGVGNTADEPSPDVIAIVERVARDWHHRLLRGLDPLTLAVLALASVRAPLDPDSLADAAGVDRAAAAGALDRARGCGLLRGSDVFVSAAAGPLRDVLGDRRIGELRHRSVVAALRAAELTPDTALLAAEAGVDDPRIVDALLAGATDATGARAAVLLRAADRVAPGRDDVRLLMAQRALASGDLDGAGDAADQRLETAGPADPGVAEWVELAATVAAHRGLASHAADLHRWVGSSSSGVQSLPAAVALLAVGDRAAVTAIAAADRGRAPVASRAARSLVTRGLLATLGDADDAPTGDDAVDAVIRGLSAGGAGFRGPYAGRILQAATAVALNHGDIVGAQTIRSVAPESGRALIDAEIALAVGDLEMTARLIPSDDPVPVPERLRWQAIRLGLARRRGDAAALTAAWQHGLSLLAGTEVDLFLLRAFGEFWIAAASVGQLSAVDRHVDTADRLLARLEDPPAWTQFWDFAGVQAAATAHDDTAMAHRLARLDLAAAENRTARSLAVAARVWVSLTPDDSEAVAATAVEVTAAVDALRSVGLHWEADRLAGMAALRADDPSTAAGLLDTARSADEERRRTPPIGGPLTEREAEVAHELLQGFTYREIGERLYISAKTVEHHVARIRRRLDAGSRSDLMAALRAAGYR